MKMTSKDILDILGIKVGDEIVVNGDKYKLIIDYKGDYIFVDKDAFKLLVEDLIDLEFEYIEHKKKVGETKCDDYEKCKDCPLKLLNCEICGYWDRNWPLYKVLNEACASTRMNADHPIYLAFKAELDNEVE